MSRGSLRRQALLWVLLCAVTVTLVFAGLFWREQQTLDALRERGDALVLEIIRGGIEQRGSSLAEQLAGVIANPLYFLDLERIDDYIRQTAGQPDVVAVQVIDHEGRVVHDDSGVLDAFGARVEPLRQPSSAVWRGDLLEVVRPVRLGQHRIGEVRVVLSLHNGRASAAEWGVVVERGLAEAYHSQLLWLGGGMGVLALLGVVGVESMRRRVLEPINALTRAAGAVEAGRYDEARRLPQRDDEMGEFSRVFARMAAAVERHEREIRRLAYLDPLTGLGNRLSLAASMESRLLTLQAMSGELALLFIDLDDIKRVNDTLGHHVGDELIVEVARRIRAACAAEGIDSAEFARFGGDEFVVLFTGTEARVRAGLLAHRLLTQIAEPLPLVGHELVVSASIGVTSFPEDAESGAQLLRNADMAMYQAKTAGKGCVRFYSRVLDEEAGRRMLLENDLRGAWERGEMSLAFQPVFDLTDGRPVGAEALLRWQHPELGLVPPSAFVAIAERSGQVDVIGQRALEEALREAATWPGGSGGRPPFVAVNISPRQLESGDLPELVEAALRATRLAPQRLHLELTETAILRDEAQAIAAFTRLRALGVGVWLDDFGTGFSGLSHLRRVPVDGVKIDRSFITDLLRDPNDLALTTGVITMAHSLGVTVVAEGIETEGQHDLLRERGCPMGQGFYLGRPLPPAEVRRLFT